MSGRALRPRFATPGWPAYRWLAVGAGILVLALSAVGVWNALSSPETDRLRNARGATAGPRTFALTPYATPKPVASVSFQDGSGRQLTLVDFKGKVVLLNVWATWCAPCRKEMPTLDRLQAQLGGKDFEVVALSIDRGGPGVVRKFFSDIGIRALALYVDPSMDAMSKLAIIGVPTTLLIDRTGREVARHTGEAEWDRPEVIHTIERHLRTSD